MFSEYARKSTKLLAENTERLSLCKASSGPPLGLIRIAGLETIYIHKM